MFSLNKILFGFLFFTFLFVNQNNIDYIGNIGYNIISKILLCFDYNFRLLLKLIGNCVFNYFYLFRICYLTSINIILTCVTNYFVIFNNLFMFSLEFIRSTIINSYIYTLSVLQIILTTPNNFLIFIYFMTKLYLNN